MKDWGLVIVLLILVAATIVLVECRYTIVVNSPVVAKLDRITGDTWIASSGEWQEIYHASSRQAPKAKSVNKAKK